MSLLLNPPHYRQKIDELLNVFATYSDQVEIAYKGWGSRRPQNAAECSIGKIPFQSADRVFRYWRVETQKPV